MNKKNVQDKTQAKFGDPCPHCAGKNKVTCAGGGVRACAECFVRVRTEAGTWNSFGPVRAPDDPNNYADPQECLERRLSNQANTYVEPPPIPKESDKKDAYAGPKVIGISGIISAGKDSIAETLINELGFRKISFADALKDATAAVFGWDRAMLEGDSDESRAWREEPDAFWSEFLGKEWTPRYALQFCGTEVWRASLSQEIWVGATKRRMLNEPDTRWVIPDVRFPNEIALIKELGGQAWRVKRGPDPEWWRTAAAGDFNAMREKWPGVHASEYMWAASDFDATIMNDGSLGDLRLKILDLVA